MKTNIVRIAYIACIPMLCAALCCCNGGKKAAEEEETFENMPEELEEVAFVASKNAQAETAKDFDEATEEAEEALEDAAEAAEDAAEAAEEAVEEAVEDAAEAVENAASELVSEAKAEEKPLTLVQVDTKPKFNGGDANEFSKWVNSKLVYPASSIDNGEQGRVITNFTVGANGKVSDVVVLMGVSEALDAEAIRVIKKSPAWTPAIKNGEAVAVSYTFPVIFKLAE